MPLPATLDQAVEAEALQYARAFVRQVRDEKIPWCGVPLSWFPKSGNRQAAIQQMKRAAMDFPLLLIDLVNYARAGAELAYDAAIELIFEYKHRRQEMQMPPSLAAFDHERDDPRRVRRHKRTGPKRADYFMRDIAITTIIGAVCSEFGLKPTRNRASKRERPCGCSIVFRALTEERLRLNINESGVMSIWARYGDIAFPGGVGAKTLPSLGF